MSLTMFLTAVVRLSTCAGSVTASTSGTLIASPNRTMRPLIRLAVKWPERRPLIRLAVKWPERRARRWRVGHARPPIRLGDTSIPGDRTQHRNPGIVVLDTQ